MYTSGNFFKKLSSDLFPIKFALIKFTDNDLLHPINFV